MKNKIFLLLVLVCITNLAEAQSNFGKRKTSRSLFTKGVRFKLKKKNKSIADSEVCLTQLKTVDSTDSSEVVSKISFKQPASAPKPASPESVNKTIEQQYDAEFQANESSPIQKKLTKQLPRNDGNSISPSIKEKQTKSSIEKTANAEKSFQTKSKVSSDIKEDLIEYGIYLLGFVICLGYLLLLYYFPIIGSIVGLIGLFTAVIYLFDGAFSLFEGFITMMDR